MRDASIDNLIEKMLSARIRESSEGCADENTMAAYLEASLTPQEKAAFEAHVSQCASCQEIMALSLKLQDQEVAGRSADAPHAMRKALFNLSIPIPVLGAAFVAIVLFAVLFRVIYNSHGDLQKSQSAELHRPAQQAETAVRNTPAQAPMANKGNLALGKPGIKAQLTEKEAEKSASAGPRPAAGSGPPAAPALEIGTFTSGEAGTRDKAEPHAPLLRGEESISRSPIYAAQNRIAAEAAMNMAPISAMSPKAAILQLGDPANLEAIESKKIGEKDFYLNSGYWIDRQCVVHQGDPIIEITYDAPEYDQILTRYPELHGLRTVLVHLDGKNYLLKP